MKSNISYLEFNNDIDKIILASYGDKSFIF